MRLVPMPNSPTPALPRLPARILRGLLPLAERDEILEDFAVEHAERLAASGPLAARLWIWRQVVASYSQVSWRSEVSF